MTDAARDYPVAFELAYCGLQSRRLGADFVEGEPMLVLTVKKLTVKKEQQKNETGYYIEKLTLEGEGARLPELKRAALVCVDGLCMRVHSLCTSPLDSKTLSSWVLMPDALGPSIPAALFPEGRRVAVEMYALSYSVRHAASTRKPPYTYGETQPKL
jgi:hypothetical protein